MEVSREAKQLRRSASSISGDLDVAPADERSAPDGHSSRSGELDVDSFRLSADIRSSRRPVSRTQELVPLTIRPYRVTSTYVPADKKTVRMEETSRSGDLDDAPADKRMTPGDAPSISGDLDRDSFWRAVDIG
jgi:hypothetical protein